MTVCESTGDLMMILTLAEEGNLNRQIARAEETNFAKIADIVTRLAFNLESLHDDIGMCHRNIHSENILCVDEDYYLVDYRFSTAADEATKVTKSSQVHYGMKKRKRIGEKCLQCCNYYRKSALYCTGSCKR
jgi:tRNA A-37 threonylcarbamoyl transferase component Bud32